MPTNVGGDSARLFPWQMVHYIVHGGPNDPSPLPTTQGTPTALFTGVSAAGTADGCYLSAWKTTGAGVTSVNFITVPPLPGSVAPPPYIPIPRTQQMFGGTGTGAAIAAAATSVTTNAGGVYLGTVPQGAWMDSVDYYVYSAFSGNNGTCFAAGVFYAQANAYNSSNTPGYQPATVYPIAFVSGGGAANTLYSTETGQATAFTNTQTSNLGPGIGQSAFTAGSLASVSDIDLYFIVFCAGTSTTNLATGSAAVRIKFTGLEG
jgi:hypothetical protein